MKIIKVKCSDAVPEKTHNKTVKKQDVFESKAQQGYLFAKKPAVAKEFASKTPKSAYKSLPKHVGDDKVLHLDEAVRNYTDGIIKLGNSSIAFQLALAKAKDTGNEKIIKFAEDRLKKINNAVKILQVN